MWPAEHAHTIVECGPLLCTFNSSFNHIVFKRVVQGDKSRPSGQVGFVKPRDVRAQTKWKRAKNRIDKNGQGNNRQLSPAKAFKARLHSLPSIDSLVCFFETTNT
jgi:hypothetical protein